MLRRIEVTDIELNMIFSAPVFFEDGKNMFLAEGKAVKAYHLAALKKWKVPFLLTSGKAIEQGEGSNIERIRGGAPLRPSGDIHGRFLALEIRRQAKLPRVSARFL